MRGGVVALAVTGLLAACGGSGGGTAATIGSSTTSRSAVTASRVTADSRPAPARKVTTPAVASWKLGAVKLQVPKANQSGAFTTPHTAGAIYRIVPTR